jgi:hypothetical protein
MMLVSMLFPAFLLIGCDAPTGLDRVDNREEITAPDREEDAGSAEGRAAADELCFQYKGELVCPNEDDRQFAR